MPRFTFFNFSLGEKIHTLPSDTPSPLTDGAQSAASFPDRYSFTPFLSVELLGFHFFRPSLDLYSDDIPNDEPLAFFPRPNPSSRVSPLCHLFFLCLTPYGKWFFSFGEITTIHHTSSGAEILFFQSCYRSGFGSGVLRQFSPDSAFFGFFKDPPFNFF